MDTDKQTYKKLIICKHCVYYRERYNDWDVCSLYDVPRLETDFCSKAKRKENDESQNKRYSG